jgi:hypothetical protein
MQAHECLVQCLGTLVCCQSATARSMFDESKLVLYVPEGWRLVLRDGTLIFVCPACWKAITT